jgi:hypothetical protein
MLIVTTLLEASWAVRIGLVVAVVVIGLAYVLWQNRAEIGSAGVETAAGPVAGMADVPAPPVPTAEAHVDQGDSPHE